MGYGERLMSCLDSINPEVLRVEDGENPAEMLRRNLQARVDAVNARDRDVWGGLDGREAWEAFAGPRVEALRRSLGRFPETAGVPEGTVAGVVTGKGYRIENLVFESRPGLPVAANLYLPDPPGGRMPGFLLVHSHHNPKTQGELQDMGMLWARRGCAVLVMDQLAYGERRQHAPGPRQDYRFRYVSGVQLQLIGDSLMGWMVWDIRRGLDVLLNREGVDPERIVVMGSVAGGGDPAAVAAALDKRVACAIPFNFGGPQPETVYPLPEDAEESFNYMGWGGWESTRNLALSGRDGFLPWVIVGSVAPRRLIYAHEFSWDRERDPVWKRLETVFEWYGTGSRPGFAHGHGLLKGRPPEASHCNNVGPFHRKMIHPLLERWFGIGIPEEDVQERRPEEDLQCFTPGAMEKHPARPLHELWEEIGASRAADVRKELAVLEAGDRRKRVQELWAGRLGNVEPEGDPGMLASGVETAGDVRVERVALQVEPGIVVPVLLLSGKNVESCGQVVVGLSQEGKAGFLKERSGALADLLEAGAVVCLPDVRGTGETRPDSSRRPRSGATSLASTELMLGQTLVGSRLRDLRSVLRYLRSREEMADARFALWGDSFSPPNPAGFEDPLVDPLGDEEHPVTYPEPLGGLLALLGALFEEDVYAVWARGTLAGFRSVLKNRFCYLPYDAVVPGALCAGDLDAVVSALAPRPLRLEALVDGRNCQVDAGDAEAMFEMAREAYSDLPGNLVFAQEDSTLMDVLRA